MIVFAALIISFPLWMIGFNLEKISKTLETKKDEQSTNGL
jgi:hypothetical protein